MGRTACTAPQCLYKGALYLTFIAHLIDLNMDTILFSRITRHSAHFLCKHFQHSASVPAVRRTVRYCDLVNALGGDTWYVKKLYEW